MLGGSHFLDENLQGFHSDSQSENQRFIVLVGYDFTHSCLSYILIALSVCDVTILLFHSMAESASAFCMAEPASV